MPPGIFECECGFVLPSNWVNGQLVPDESTESMFSGKYNDHVSKSAGDENKDEGTQP